jgi:hypothetical protein
LKVSELIADAQKVLAEHGDIEVITRDDGCGCCSCGYIPAGLEVTDEAYGLDLEEGTYLAIE